MDQVAATPRYYGQFDPPVDQFLHQRYFSHNPRNGVLIECGAFDGEYESSGKFFEEFLGWKCYNLEASPRIFAVLDANRPQGVNIPVALSAGVGTAEFHDVHHPDFELCTNGSIRHTAEHMEWLQAAKCRLETSSIFTTSLARFVIGYQIQRIDLMILDVEGHELEALDGFRDSPILPQVLLVEHGQLGVDAIRQAVEPLGYRWDAEHFVNSAFVRR